MESGKRNAQSVHARRRLAQRYGRYMSRSRYEGLVRRVLAGDCVFLERQTHRTSLAAVREGGEWLPLVWDRQRRAVVTFLPAAALDRHRERLERPRAGKAVE